MDCKTVGETVRKLRKELGLCQRELAERLNISNKTVSKWERGLGCPDVDLLCELSKVLGVSVEGIIGNQQSENTALSGNMKKSKLYYCPICGNLVVSLGEADVVCCGKKLKRLCAEKAEGEHILKISPVEDEWFVECDHAMEKDHYITAVFFLTGNMLEEVKLYPEQQLSVRFKRKDRGTLYFICNRHGGFCQNV